MITEGTVRFEWRAAGPITLDANRFLVLPPLPSAPGVYRVSLTGRAGQHLPEVYIGEGGSLRSRLANYRRPSTKYTAGHNHDLWVSHLARGGVMHLEVIESAEIVVGSQPRPLPLMRTSARVLVETTALALEYLAGTTVVLNRDAGADEFP
ncbi:hypothetical protein ABZ215_30015 [Amycolatopsis sp. NPDC006131]|uniref:hypothetical protein n=1 Tax=Amycolatopsis sp. NPDC006131 TaxID=3156731 RepID=UPI0033A14C4B